MAAQEWSFVVVGECLSKVVMSFFIYFSSLLIVFIIFLIRCWQKIREQFLGLSAIDALIILSFLLVGALLRFWGTYHIDLDPYGWSFVVDASRINKFSFTPLASHVPGFAFMIALPLLWAKSLSLVSGYLIIFSVLTIVLVYLLTFLITQNRFAAIIAAGLFLTSRTAIQFSGQEIPITLSVFFLTGAFFIYFLWLRDRDLELGILMLLCFFISFNMKTENVIFLPLLFIAAMFDRKKVFFVFLVMLLGVSVLVWYPYVADAMRVQSLTWSYFSNNYSELYGLKNLVVHFNELIVGRCYLYPVLVMIGFVFLRQNILVLVWFVMTLLYLLWYSDFCVQLNMLQVLMPVFVMSGCVFARLLEVYIKARFYKFIVFAGLLVILMMAISGLIHAQKPYSWVDLKKDFPRISEKDCIVSPDRPFTGFALPFLFPDKHWIVSRDNAQGQVLMQCEGIYYFDTTPFGLAGESVFQDSSAWADFLREKVMSRGGKYKGVLTVSMAR